MGPVAAVTWFKLSDHFYDHPKVMAAGNSAVGLWSRCASYTAKHELDGRIPRSVAHTWGSRKDISRLLETGLWIECEESYWMPNFLEYNPSAEKIRTDRAAGLERQKAWKEKHVINAVTNGLQTRE
jgi:hypothetical protein